MARKKKHEEHVNHERWLVSYADFITLLFATFTALFAMSNADKAKLEAAAKSIKKAFASGGSMFSTPTVKTQDGGAAGGNLIIQISPSTPSPLPPGSPGAKKKKDGNEESEENKEYEDTLFEGPLLKKNPDDPEVDPDAESAPTPTPTPTPTPAAPSISAGAEGGGTEALSAEIKELMQNIGLDKVVEVRNEQRGMVISLGEAAFFAQGDVEVLPSCINQLDKIVNALRNKSFEIRVEGHTDNTPVRSGRYRDNWELSTMRAASIVHFMEKEYHFDPASLSVAGYGETRPLAPNDTRENRQKNRRVDIVILNERAKTAEPPKKAESAEPQKSTQ